MTAETDTYVDSGETYLFGSELLEAIRSGAYWAECSQCGVKITSDMEAYDGDDEDDICSDGVRVLEPCCLLNDPSLNSFWNFAGVFADGFWGCHGVFCCRDCRGEWQRQRIVLNTLAMEQVRIVRKTFGHDVHVKVSRGSRSGLCRCCTKYEYPGVVDFALPEQLQFGKVTGCALCGTWGVPKGDIESGAWQQICSSRGIVTEGKR